MYYKIRNIKEINKIKTKTKIKRYILKKKRNKSFVQTYPAPEEKTSYKKRYIAI